MDNRLVINVSDSIITKVVSNKLVYSNPKKGIQKILDSEATNLIKSINKNTTKKSLEKKAGKKFIKMLFEDGLIIEVNKQNSNQFRPNMVCNSKTFLESPDEIFFEITEKCNLNCLHCYSNDKQKNELSTKEIKKLIKKLAQKGVFGINIGGGEPTTRTDLIEIVNFSSNNNVRITISTNCTKLTHEYIKNLKAAGVYSIQISLEGPQKENDIIRGEGHFEKAKKAAISLTQNKVPFAVSIVPNKLNYLKIYETAKIAKKWGAKRFRATRLIPTNQFTRKNLLTKSEYDIVISQLIKAQKLQSPNFIVDIDESFKCLIPELKNINLPEIFDPFKNDSSCVAGKTLCGILADGTVTPCAYLRINCGNIRKQNFFEIWKNSKILKKLRKQVIPECQNCKNYKIECKGGCRAVAYYLTGNLFGKDYICNEVIK